MIIRTSQDAALVSCCGCLPPEAPAPRKECQSLTAIGYLHGFVNDDLPREQWYDTLYKKLRQQYADNGHWYTYEWNTIIEVRLGGKLVSDPMVRTDDNGGPETYHQPATDTYSDGITFADAVTEMVQIAKDAVDWDDEQMNKGNDCSTRRVENYSQFSAGGYRPNDFSLIFVRYRIGVPDGFSTESAPRSVYEALWDEVFFPKEWDDWKALKDAYDLAVAEHTTWENEDPETRGDEPEIPDDPGEAPSPAPSLVASRSWSWSGNRDEPWSDWFDMEMPESPGETRLVNMMVVSFHDRKRGVKPTTQGEVYQLPD